MPFPMFIFKDLYVSLFLIQVALIYDILSFVCTLYFYFFIPYTILTTKIYFPSVTHTVEPLYPFYPIPITTFFSVWVFVCI